MTGGTLDREDDVDSDSRLANPRATGGGSGQDEDSGATTRTGRSGELAGRAQARTPGTRARPAPRPGRSVGH